MSEAPPNSSALGWIDDIEDATLANGNVRTVLFTGAHLQLTVRSTTNRAPPP